MTSLPPSDTDLRRYAAGTLDTARFQEIDAWLATLPESEVERLLTAAGIAEPATTLPVASSAAPESGFRTTQYASRLAPGTTIGQGGMAEILTAHDQVLGRTVALKVMRPRGASEPFPAFLARQELFRREAAITAILEHPAIPPVYDVGQLDGRAAFTLHRIEGRTLEQVVRSGERSRADLLELLARVTDAVAYAHARGVVHRDLTSANILVAGFGAVYVIDWGLAGRCGEGDSLSVGTPGWMAPEQAQGAPPDPRQDVFALGRLLLFVLSPPDQPLSATPEAEQAAIAHLPAGLRALVGRCLDPDAPRRYPDGSAVAAELHRWLSEGVTLAQDAGGAVRLWIRLRRSRQARVAVLLILLATLLALASWWRIATRDEQLAVERVARIARETALDRPEALAVGLAEARAVVAEHPGLIPAATLVARLQVAADVAAQHAQQAQVSAALDRLLQRTRVLGPWADQIDDWLAALRQAGLALDAQHPEADEPVLRTHPQAALLAAGLPFLWRAERERGATGEAERTAKLLAAAGPTPGWQAFGRQLQITVFTAHDPTFCVCPDSEAILAEPAAAAVALAIYGPEARLTAYAQARLRDAPGDFWPLLAAARAARAAPDDQLAERLALVASGAEPDSLLPRLVLAYIALDHAAWPELLAQAERALHADPGNIEAKVLRTVAWARLGRLDEARTALAALPAGHLQYHLQHPVGHPMEGAVRALIEAGLLIPAAPADLGPLVPQPPVPQR